MNMIRLVNSYFSVTKILGDFRNFTSVIYFDNFAIKTLIKANFITVFLIIVLFRCIMQVFNLNI